jgi:hypothetical protein
MIRVHHLFLGAPALRGPLLEEAPGIRPGLVAVLDVAQLRFLHGGGQGDARRAGRQSPAHRHRGDQGGVRRLVGCQFGFPGPHSGSAHFSNKRFRTLDESHSRVDSAGNQGQGQPQYYQAAQATFP